MKNTRNKNTSACGAEFVTKFSFMKVIQAYKAR
jgi:hypothetical protein